MSSAIVVAALLVPPLVWAHDTLVRSTPAANARLSRPPTELRLTFTTAVEPRVSRVQLLGPDSLQVSLGELARHPDSARVLLVPIAGPLVAGVHTVVWQIVGADGHPVRGSYRFTVLLEAAGAPAPIPGTPRDTDTVGEPAPHTAHDGSAARPARFDTRSPLFVLVRWLSYLGVLGAIGATGLRLLVLPRAGAVVDAERLSGRTARFGLALAVLTVAAGGLRLVAQTAALSLDGPFDAGTMRDIVFASGWGAAWLLHMGAAGLAAAGFALAGRGPGAARLGWGIAALAVSALAVSLALSGHSAASPRLPALTVVLDALHVLAAGGWLGALLALAVVGIPSTLDQPQGERGLAISGLVNAFSPAALAFAGLAVITGAFAAWVHAGLPPAFLGAPYGRVLILKVVALAAVAALGLYNWRWIRPRLAEERLALRFRRTATLELAFGALVLAATAVLVATPPPAH